MISPPKTSLAERSRSQNPYETSPIPLGMVKPTTSLRGQLQEINPHSRMRQSLMALVLVCILTLGTACGGIGNQTPQSSNFSFDRSAEYAQLTRGNSATGQAFGDWVVEASKGLITDAFVRDNNKLGAVISTKVRPDDVKALAQSLAQGFRKSFPDQDLSILVYAPDKKLILTARYDASSRQIEYQAAS